MGGLLTEDQVSNYAATGQVGPVSLLDADEVSYYRAKLESAESAFGEPLSQVPGQFRAKTHLLYTWMDDLVRHDKILDAVESLIGPDIPIVPPDLLAEGAGRRIVRVRGIKTAPILT